MEVSLQNGKHKDIPVVNGLRNRGFQEVRALLEVIQEGVP